MIPCASISEHLSGVSPRARPSPVWLALIPAALMLAGCGTVSTLTSVATAPIKLTSKAVDLATTSQSEADENRGRDLRLAERERGKLVRDYERSARKCQDGDEDACEKRDQIRAQLENGTGARQY